MAVILAKNLKKNYGRNTGIKDVSFSADEGDIFGFAGPNGAGKSTVIRILMNNIYADSGTAEIKGLSCASDSKKIKEFTGYVPCDVRMYPDLRVSELLRVNAGFYKKDLRDETERLLALFGLDEKKRFRELSAGNRKKTALVCALSPQPGVLILDEPAAGLDPLVQAVLFEELKKRAAEGACIMLSSHSLSDIQEYCSKAAFIHRGEILSITELNEKTLRKRKAVSFTGGNPPENTEVTYRDSGIKEFYTSRDGQELISMLSEINPDSFTVENESIEDRFMTLYKGEYEK